MQERLTVGALSCRGVGPAGGGRVRNEDNFLVGKDGQLSYLSQEQVHRSPWSGHGSIVAVADGMGGHQHGALASASAVLALARFYSRARASCPETALHTFVVQAHRRLRTKAIERGASNMGTTLTGVWIIEDQAHWVHVGDSRLYHLRAGNLIQISCDHTRAEFYQRDGRPAMSGDEHTLSQNFLFGSRGLGNDADIRIDPGTDTGTIQLLPGDRLLLTSDGLHRFMTHEKLGETLGLEPGADETARLLVAEALRSGSDDNLTAVVVCFERS